MPFDPDSYFPVISSFALCLEPVNNLNPQLVPLGPETACHLCGEAGLAEFLDFRAPSPHYLRLPPWPAGGRLCGCPNCGSVQKLVDAVWNREVEELYAGYAIYDQAEGAEQAVFDPSGTAASRSRRLLAALCENRLSPSGRGAGDEGEWLPATGRMLDVGCGNGAMLARLRRCHRLVAGRHGTQRTGTRRQVEGISGVESLYTCPPEEVPGQFNAITLIHVLEHIPEPAAFLKHLLPKLVPGGLLVVELPHQLANPFELLIADHCTLFPRQPRLRC